MTGAMTELERIVRAPRSRSRERAAHELLAYAADVQDLVLDRQWNWIDELPVSEEVRALVFRRVCATTGQLIDGLFLRTEPIAD